MNYYDFVISLVQEAGEHLKIARVKTFEVSHKGADEKDLVTSVDIEISEFLVAKIKHTFPDHRIYSEEDKNTTETLTTEYQWSIDPIDGSANFARGIPHFAVCVALLCKGSPLVGAVYNPVTDELFSFEQGRGAFLNGIEVHVTDITELREVQGIFIIGHQPPLWEWGMATYRTILEAFRKLKNFGSSALDLSFLATGRADIVIYGTLTTNDCAAGIGMVRAAGGEVYTPYGEVVKLTATPQVIIATANKELFDKVCPLLHQDLLPHWAAVLLSASRFLSFSSSVRSASC